MLKDNNNLFIKRLHCPICQSKNLSILFNIKRESSAFLEFLKNERFYSKKFYEKYFNGLLNGSAFEIVRCEKCDFIFQSEVLNETGMSLLYNEWLDQSLLLKYYSEMKPDKIQENTLRIISKFYKNKKKNINVLDFGAGYGNFCTLSSELGFNTYAFDLSNDKTNHISSKPGINLISDFNEFQSFFDFIYINQVLEHLSNPTGIVTKLQNCLSPAGILFIAVPNCKRTSTTIARYGLSQKLFGQLSPHQHINAFNNKTLALLGRKSGLKKFNLIDFMRLYNWTLTPSELKLLLKLTKHTLFGTSQFFHKDI
jgi:2-polyprenyl-3-methyl-5-hydroxy-6-metoxy-1,4-benzoquinol methylase